MDVEEHLIAGVFDIHQRPTGGDIVDPDTDPMTAQFGF